MRYRFGWPAWLLALGVALAPPTARSQTVNNGYEVPPGPTPYLPLGHPHYNEGGLYSAGEFLWWMQTNPLKSQLLAFRGLVDFDGSIHQALNIPGGAGDFIGSGLPALDVDQVSGPLTSTPGFNFVLGWRFRSGLALEASWIHLADARYSATGSLAPPQIPSVGTFQENTFLTSPVFNFTPNFAGPDTQVGAGNIGATFGIWNASTYQTIDFVQRFDQFTLTARYPLTESECFRCYGLFGPRIVVMWERFKWRTVDADINGQAFADDTATYSNVVSQRFYGLHLGMGNEWMIGDTPIGAFSISLDCEGALFVDFVKARAKYELGDMSTAASRNRNFFNLTPEVQAAFNLWWYPTEGIQVRMGYSGMIFFNTMASQRPVDFNYGALAPAWERGITRIWHGLNFGVAFVY
ncbi:MAG: hypothetical protein IT429_24010 [Gemmataceae bacterium]|nr:hypothetical protein [Gemmataceae bacterium]